MTKGKGKAVVSTAQLKVPDRPSQQMEGMRAIDLPTYLARIIPAYGHPGWLEATRWRTLVRNQPIAIICRDTLLDHIKALEWDIVPADTEKSGDPQIKKAIQYYADLFEAAEGDFDQYIDLMGQDLMDLPFGAAAELGRENDEPDAPVIWINHVDGATLLPSYDPDYPVIQSVPGMIGQAIAFPKHAIDRIMYAPRPELRRKGWAMAPPEKVYLSLEIMFRGDTYYWKLLLDTPEAGILDLMDMSEASAGQWLTGFRELLQGIDGFKVPVLYDHTLEAKWIPFNRPPIDMLYDKAIAHYAEILAAGYGMRAQDIGLSTGAGGGGTLAGVIRGERQTRRSGLANVREKFRNHFNRILPHDPTTGQSILRFVWVERDDEAMVSRGRAALAMFQAFQAGIAAGVISPEEARQETVAQGIMDTDLDPKKLPTPPAPPPGLGGLLGAPKGADAQNEKKQASVDGAVPVSQGGRGDQPKPEGMDKGATKSLSIVDRVRNFITRPEERPGVPFGKNPATKDAVDLLREMEGIIAPGLALIPKRAESVEHARLVKLVNIATRAMVEHNRPIAKALTDRQLYDYWIVNRAALAFGEENDLYDNPVIVRQDEDVKALIQAALDGEDWWDLTDAYDKQQILELYQAAYMKGSEKQALAIARSLYTEGLIDSPELVGISFKLSNPNTIAALEMRAGDLVTNINNGTQTFIKRILVAGVNQGLSSPEIAQALRDGATAERVLSDEGFMGDVLDAIMQGLTDMGEARTNSIVNYEVAWAENAGTFGQIEHNGLTEKAWVHGGPRGVTDKGNVHPCIICESNEAQGFVPIDYMYETVFEPQGFPPAHPGVCHCGIMFNPKELAKLVSEGGFAPWLGD